MSHLFVFVLAWIMGAAVMWIAVRYRVHIAYQEAEGMRAEATDLLQRARELSRQTDAAIAAARIRIKQEVQELVQQHLRDSYDEDPADYWKKGGGE